MKRSALFILASIIILNLFAPLMLVEAATDTYRPTLDESGQCVHGSLGGEFDDYGWAIFIGNDQFDTAAGIRFPNITIDQGEIINDANLTVYYPGGYDWDTGTLYLMVYGYDADNAPDDLTWSDIVNGPRTEALTVFNMSLMNTTDSYVIDVTDHVQEIVNRYNWESSNAIAFTTLHIIEEDEGEYWYEWASNTGAYKNHRPTLTIRHGEAESGPSEGDYEFVFQYEGYQIYKGAIGIRTVLIEDASGDDWIIASNNVTGTWKIYNNSLPFNVDIDPEVQDTAIVIGQDIWCLGDTGTNVSLWRSQDYGVTWKTMQSFTTTNSLEAYMMDYNSELYMIEILGYDDTNDRVFHFNYNVSTDTTITDPWIVFDGQDQGVFDIALAVDYDGYLCVAATMGGAWGTEPRLWTRQRSAAGVWSDTKIFEAGGAEQWEYVDIHIAKDTENNNKTVVFVVANSVAIYTDRKTKTDALGSLGFDSGEWPDNVFLLSRDTDVDRHFNSILYDQSDTADPYDEYFSVVAIYRDTKGGNFDTVGSYIQWPYPSISHFDNANYSSNMYYPAAYNDWTGPRWYGQDINDKTTLFEGSLEWLEMPGTYIYIQAAWNLHKKITHHEDISYYTVASNPFGDPQWLIYKNGTIIKTLPYDDNNETDITDWIDDNLFNTTDPENPSAGSRWTGSEPWYLDRSRTQLYFTIFGLGFIIPPWIIAAHKRRIDIIVTALLLNVLGFALLYGVGYI